MLAVEASDAEVVYDEQLGRGELVEAFVDGGCEPGEGYVFEEFLGAEVPDLVAEHACLSPYGGGQPALACPGGARDEHGQRLAYKGACGELRHALPVETP